MSEEGTWLASEVAVMDAEAIPLACACGAQLEVEGLGDQLREPKELVSA